MIIDIDNSRSVQSFVRIVASDWFDIDGMYYDLQSDSSTNWSDFWHITDGMINIISNYLGCTSEEFLKNWGEKCSERDAAFIGYHCTRRSDKEIFIRNGIMPLSDKL